MAKLINSEYHVHLCGRRICNRLQATNPAVGLQATF